MFNDFVVHKGHAYGFDGHVLASIDLADGKRKWKGGRYGNGQLVLLPNQDMLLVLSEEGDLALVGATPNQLRKRNWLDSPPFMARPGTTRVVVRDVFVVAATVKRWPRSGYPLRVADGGRSRAFFSSM